MKYNYEFKTQEENDNEIIPIRKNQNLSDSNKGSSIKKREKKSNDKIKISVDKIKKLYKHMNFYEAMIPPSE